MKYSEFDALIGSAVKRDNEGKITGIDAGAIINKVNGYYTDVMKGKEDGYKSTLEDTKKGAVTDFLKANNFENGKSFKTYLEDSKGFQTKYETLQGEVKTSALNGKITSTLTEMKIDSKYSATVTKLLKQDGLYGEDGALNEEALKTNITSIVTDDLMLAVEPVKAGVEPDKTQQNQTETRRKKF